MRSSRKAGNQLNIRYIIDSPQSFNRPISNRFLAHPTIRVAMRIAHNNKKIFSSKILFFSKSSVSMEVFETEKYYIFVNKGKSLWWNRTTSEFQLKCGEFVGFKFLFFMFL